ncbi:hypothetical protein ABW19_dt0209996 [Dactylella cylindrospora]|nr:hypothetical protein ABW19_dt0209996 [Dactylella cylindrospora]
MGVTGLWTVVQPCARPVKLETLAQKRLAIDASIWIYQFLKAVRDKEGNALRNAHVVGFFRRIVKLLFHGIRPVFVFDGGAPLLKRQTIANRKTRREGRKEDATRTAGKLLSLQMQKRAKEEAERRRRQAETYSTTIQEEEAVPENPVYASELFQAPEERKKNKTAFRKTDQYHLPELDQSLESMGGVNDPRIMSMDELEAYARQFEGGEDINLYDFSKIDFDSPFFNSLPAADRYNILNAARIRSRLRMGLSKEQLEDMFPNRLEFSRFQIERVRERNELTQRLMHINGMSDDLVGVHRVAGEKDREYVLVKNEGADGGWALGVVGKKGDREGETKHTAIDVDAADKMEEDEDDWEDEMEDFEDIPIEGLNRLPKPKPRLPIFHLPRRRQTSEERELQRAIKLSKQEQQKKALKEADEGAVFIQDDELNEFDEADDEGENGYEDLFEDIDDLGRDLEAEDLRKAIAMSLEKDKLEGEEEERALELALKMSMQDDGWNDAGPSAAPVAPLAPKPSQPSLNASKPAFIEQALNPSKPKFVEQPLNPAKPKFTELEETSNIPKSKYWNDAANSLDTDGDKGKRSVAALNPSKQPFEEIETAVASNPFDFGDGDGDFNLESAMAASLPQSRLPELTKAGRGDGPGISFLPFESMKIGGLAGLKKRREEEEAAKAKEDADNKKVELPPWFSAQETEAFKTGSTGYRVDNYDRDDFLEAKRPTTPEYLKPIDKRVSIQPPRKDVIVVSEDESEDVNMIDLTTPAKSVAQSQATENTDNMVPRTEPQTNRASPRAEGSPSDEEEIEWEPSDTEAPAVAADAAPVQQSDEDDHALSSDEEDLIHRLEAENAEHARFASTFNQRPAQENEIDYDRELRALRDQQKKDRRDADEVNHIMIMECQQLLQMFGIPYITAPMEAEAQCAELVKLGLVDGIVTDDSDIFLFGGTRIYKNMFNQAKFVECYLASDLENEYSLDRRKLIRLAHLLGSDYTEGLPNVGPVTALEILADFGGEDALEAFKTWWTRIQSGRSDPSDDKSKLKKKLKKLSEKLFLPPSFPDERVDLAYLNPEVDTDTTPFEWGTPDLQGLRNFLMATIGWSTERTDEVLVPVIRDMNRKVAEGNQVNITNYFTGGTGAGAFAPRVREANKSKRMENALMSLHRQALKRQGSDGLASAGDDLGKVDESSSTDEELQGIVSLNGRVQIPGGGKSKGKTPASKKRRTGKSGSETGSSEVEIVGAKQAKAPTRGRKSASRARGRGKKAAV